LLLTSEDGSTINYTVGGGNDTDISTATFTKVSASLNSQDNDVRDVKWNNDGTKMFMLGRSNDSVYEYSASLAFDVSSITYVRLLDIGVVSATQGDNAANSISFNTDGTKLFVLGQGQNLVNEYALSTGFDLSTASFTHSFNIGSQEASAYGLAFSNDGTKMFVTGWNGDDINEYTLSTGFDVSTASYSQRFSVSSECGKPSSVQFDSDGTTMYVLNGSGVPKIYQYKLETAFDVSTASYTGKLFEVTDQETKPRGFCFGGATGQKLYVAGWTGDDINQYSLDATVVLSTPPASGTQIKILHKKGQVWYTAKDGNPADGKGLQGSSTQQAKFIANDPTNAPE
jgi:sugar lactone lactonase YvrE